MSDSANKVAERVQGRQVRDFLSKTSCSHAMIAGRDGRMECRKNRISVCVCQSVDNQMLSNLVVFHQFFVETYFKIYEQC